MRNRTIIIRLFFLFCFAVFPSAYAQDMSFNYLTTDNGLSQFTVYALYNDEWGQIWIGTRDGLNVDGNFKLNVPNAKTAVLQISFGSIWKNERSTPSTSIRGEEAPSVNSCIRSTRCQWCYPGNHPSWSGRKGYNLYHFFRRCPTTYPYKRRRSTFCQRAYSTDINRRIFFSGLSAGRDRR